MSNLTKRQVEAIARSFVQSRQDVWNSHSFEQWKSCRDSVSSTLKALNSKFDEKRFEELCNEDW